MYFGQSLGHIGADFRGLIAPVFINVTVKRFSDLLKMTEITWQTDLQTFLKTNIKNVRMNQTHDEVRLLMKYELYHNNLYNQYLNLYFIR